MISLTSPVETRAHAWPAGVKLLALALATAILLAIKTPLFQAGALLLCLSLYALCGRQFLATGLRRLWPLWPFVVLVGVWNLVIGEVELGMVIVLRLVTAVGFANLVTMTTRLSDMIAVVHWLATPLRKLGLSTRALELGLALVIRFTPALADKGTQLSQAWRARSPKRQNWRVILPFTVLAIDDAEHVAEAIRARGGLVKDSAKP